MPVRIANENDADAIGLVHVRSWQATYRGHFPKEFLESLDPDQRVEQWRRLMRDDEPRSTLLVTEQDGEIVGFANFGPCRDDEPAMSGEVRAIYLLPRCWDAGLGRELMIAGLGALAATGFSDSVLWVLEGNDRARRFYERGGWLLDGTVRQDEGFGFPIREVRYRRALP